MIDVENFRIRLIIEIIQELFEVKEVFMEHLNNFKNISGIKNFTALLKVKENLLLVHHLENVEYTVTVVLCVSIDI